MSAAAPAIRNIAGRAALALAAGVLAAALGGLALASALDDALHCSMPRSPAQPAAAVVLGIDAADPWPWPNGRLATLLDRLRAAGARGIALDLPLRDDTADAEGDARLARSLLDNRVVLGVALLPETGGLPQARLPPVEFTDAARLGHVVLPRDPDGRIRRHLPHLLAGDGIRWPSLPLALVQPGVATGAGPWKTGERWMVPYAAAPPTWRAAEVLDGRLEASRLRGQWVLLGLTDPARQAPIPGPHGSAPLFPVEHEARALAALLQGGTVRALPAAVQALLALLLAGVAVFAALARGGPEWRPPVALLAGVAVAVAVSAWLYSRHWWFAPGGTVAVLGLGLLAWAAAALRRQWRLRRRLPGLATRANLHATLQAARTAATPHALLLLAPAVQQADGAADEAEAHRVAALLHSRARRPGDVAAYLGDGRFALFLPGTSAAAAARILAEIRRDADDQALALEGGVQACGSDGCDCLRRLAARTAPA